MPAYRLMISREMDGSTVRHAVLYGLQLSSGQYKRAKFHGQVLLDGTPAMANARLREGQLLELRIPEKENTPPEPCELPLEVAFEDEYLLLVDKPAPLPSASSARQSQPTLENAVYRYLGSPTPFVYRPVNRLDKGTSGLMVVAKTAHVQHLMQMSLHTDDFVREYLAVLEGKLPKKSGVIELPIAKAEGATVRREVNPCGKAARTFYWTLRETESRTLAGFRLDTGRTHQIRVHASALGCPVAGDFLYGTELDTLAGRFALHSCHCRLRHPVTGEWIERVSPLPEELERLLQE
ncbi:MAG: RluA family pseudouridine synthase [Eubacteriales bacterium]|nr:RluA family pseudouridine synthase [Eubacteriales bacterium]